MGTQDKSLDLIWGIRDIAKFIGRTERQTYDMCADGHLPVRRVGARHVAERGQLARFFMEPASGEGKAA